MKLRKRFITSALWCTAIASLIARFADSNGNNFLVFYYRGFSLNGCTVHCVYITIHTYASHKSEWMPRENIAYVQVKYLSYGTLTSVITALDVLICNLFVSPFYLLWAWSLVMRVYIRAWDNNYEISSIISQVMILKILQWGFRSIE